MDRRSIAVIGGGAAGFFGAIAAAENRSHPRVALYEAGSECLAKVRISGGGRCNVTHHCFEPAQLVQQYPRGSKALRGPFSRFQPRDTIDWYRRRGVMLKTEADGRMFPTTDSSATVVDCLTTAAQRAGVVIHTRSPIKAVERSSRGFRLIFKTGQTECDRILLATGSSPQGHRLAQGLGHHIEPPVPSLFTFTVKDKALHQRSGLAVSQATITLKLPGQKKALSQTGPLLITHWGLSGPAVLKLSAWGARLLSQSSYRATATINWLPALTSDDLRSELLATRSAFPKRAAVNQNPTALPKRLWSYFLQRAGIEPQAPWTSLSNKALNRLTQELLQGEYAIAGKGAFKEEFVTCGGVRLREVDFKTMESRLCPGLFFAGEVLDIDGITGGFNFQSAWTTAWLAGQAMA